MNAFDYDTAFTRNIGWVTPVEQQKLRRARVAIAGLGGVGGFHLLTLARLGIGEKRLNRPLEQMSRGMQQKVAIARALLTSPTLLLLDEPTTGLDPRSRNQVWDLVRRIADEGTTVLLTTQYLDEADQLADRIALLDQGRVVAEGTPGELKRRIPGGHLLLRFTDPAALHAAAGALGTAQRDDEALTLQVPSDGDVASLRAVLDTLDRVRAEPDHLTIHTPDLDDVFFAFTGGAVRADAVSEESR